MITPPPLAKLRAHVRVSGQELTLQVPAWHWAWRGLALALVVPPLIVLLAVLVAFATARGGAAEPSPIFAGAAAMAFFAGLGLALLSPLFSKRTRVVVDLERRVVVTASRAPIPFDTLADFRVVSAGRASFLSASRAGGADVTLLGPLCDRQLSEARALADWLRAELTRA